MKDEVYEDRSIVGSLINFRGMVYSPINEQGVILLFGKILKDLNMYVEEIKTGYPDCVARRRTGKGWERIYIEFEYSSSGFKSHFVETKYKSYTMSLNTSSSQDSSLTARMFWKTQKEYWTIIRSSTDSTKKNSNYSKTNCSSSQTKSKPGKYSTL